MQAQTDVINLIVTQAMHFTCDNVFMDDPIRYLTILFAANRLAPLWLISMHEPVHVSTLNCLWTPEIHMCDEHLAVVSAACELRPVSTHGDAQYSPDVAVIPKFTFHHAGHVKNRNRAVVVPICDTVAIRAQSCTAGTLAVHLGKYYRSRRG